MTLSLTNSSSEEVWSKTGEAIDNTGSWDLTQLHCFNIGNLAAGDYTLTLSITAKEGSYAGNWGDFCFHTTAEAPLPTSTDPYLNMVEGSFVNTRYNSDNVINYIRPDGYIDNLVFYNATAGYYMFNFKNSESNSAYSDAQIKLNVYDAFTGEQEGEYTIDASTSSTTNKDAISGRLTTGWKKIRITFVSATAKGEEDADGTGETKKYLFNFANAYFTSITDNLPMYGTTVLDLSKGSMTSSSNPRYSSSSGTNNEISFIYNGGIADKFFVLIDGDETAYYDLRTTTSNYNKGGTFKVTITDVNTGIVEVNAEESPEITANNQSIVMPLSGILSPGLKKIRFDFAKEDEEAWLFNIKDICFYKRSLNENYSFENVAATDVDVVLTRTINTGKWNTIVLPFDMTAEQITSTFGAGTLIAQMTGMSRETVTFSKVTAMNAHEPYLIFVTSDFSSATINGVTVTEGTPKKNSVSGIDLIGSYNASTDIPYSDGSTSYYFISNNELYRSSTGTTHDTMKGTRAYFKVPGTTAARLGFVVEDQETNGLQQVATESQQQPAIFYDLQGRRVKTFKKGVYMKRSAQGNLLGRNTKKIIM